MVLIFCEKHKTPKFVGLTESDIDRHLRDDHIEMTGTKKDIMSFIEKHIIEIKSSSDFYKEFKGLSPTEQLSFIRSNPIEAGSIILFLEGRISILKGE